MPTLKVAFPAIETSLAPAGLFFMPCRSTTHSQFGQCLIATSRASEGLRRNAGSVRRHGLADGQKAPCRCWRIPSCSEHGPPCPATARIVRRGFRPSISIARGWCGIRPKASPCGARSNPPAHRQCSADSPQRSALAASSACRNVGGARWREDATYAAARVDRRFRFWMGFGGGAGGSASVMRITSAPICSAERLQFSARNSAHSVFISAGIGRKPSCLR